VRWKPETVRVVLKDSCFKDNEVTCGSQLMLCNTQDDLWIVEDSQARLCEFFKQDVPNQSNPGLENV